MGVFAALCKRVLAVAADPRDQRLRPNSVFRFASAPDSVCGATDRRGRKLLRRAFRGARHQDRPYR